MSTDVPVIAELIAPAEWRTIDVLSDVHLQPSEMETFEAWRNAVTTSDADALFILGDLFEAWVGDDALDPAKGDDSAQGDFERQCASVLHEVSQKRPVYFMHGNRDFLLGDAGLAACGMQLLQDPTLLRFGGTDWLLSHGDALCIGDVAYQRFRAQVRSSVWQQSAMQQPLQVRRSMARLIREASVQKQSELPAYADVDASASGEWLNAASASALIHGHTHMPADHHLDNGLQRIVLSDWDASATPPRCEMLRLEAGSAQARRLKTCAR